jgi:hypothetical protein
VKKVQRIERQITSLSPNELAELRAWFLEFDWATWDQRLERDVHAGKLDALADEAIQEHAAGDTRPI